MISRFSYSSLGSFLNCPRQFKFQKIDRVPVPKCIGADMHLGNTIHRQLQTVYQWAADGKLLPLDRAIAAFEADWETGDREYIVVRAEHMTVDDYIENGRKMLRRFYDRYQPFDQGTLLGAEMTINFELPVSGTLFQAKIDRLWRRPDGVVEICDYKTGKIPPQGIRDPHLRRQMGLYQIAVQTAFPDFDDIEIALYFLRHDERLSCRLLPEELDLLAEQVRVDILSVHHAERLDDFPTRESGLCDYCEYLHLCPAKRHRLILEDEAGAGGEEKATAATAAELADRYIEINTKYNEAKAERDALKQDLIQAAKDLGVDKLSGTETDLSVKVRADEKFIGKSADPNKAGDLNHLARQWGFEDYFTLDANQFMKEIYRKGRLTDNQKQQLEDFIQRRETATVRVLKRKSTNDDD